MQKIVLCLIMTAGLLQVTAQNNVPDSVAEKLNKAIADFKTKQHCPGLAVAVVKGNDMVYSQALGYTDMDSKSPVTIDTRFPIMSVSKTFTAAMMVQLAERGVLSMHDKITKYVPEYKVTSDFPGPVNTTLYQLATHASGLPRNTPADIQFAQSLDRWLLTDGKEPIKWFTTDKELLNSLQYIKLDYPSYDFISYGDRHYSNLGYSVLGIALQRAAKIDFATYVVNNICKPLQMTSTGFLSEPGIHARIAKGYRYSNKTGAYNQVPGITINSALYPGGMYSTARDLCRYLSFQYESNDAQHAKVLSPESRAMMHSLRIGWKPAFPYVTHEGAIPGYRSMTAFNPGARLGWVILTNGFDIDFNPLNNAMAGILGAAYKKIPDTDITKFAGTYQLPQNLGSMTISVKNDSLYSTYLQDLLPGKPLVKDNNYRFHVEGIDGYTIGYEFMVDEQGNINRLRLNQLTWYKQ